MTLESNSIPDYIKFAIGGSSGILTTLIVQPFDFLKTRMQISGQDSNRKSYRNILDVVREIKQNEGILALYSGLTAALFRQATYTTAKLGIYSMLYERFSVESHQPHFIVKLLIGMFAGIIGACIGTPSEVALIRMTADGILPLEQKWNYHHVFHAFICIIKEEGIFGLWKSALPTISRGAVVSLVQLASYSQAKQMIIEINLIREGLLLHFLASMISGFNTTITSMPIDIIKTRIQNMKIINGIPEYSGCWNVICRIYKNEGFRSFWKGFTPYFLKICSNTVLMFIFFEQISATYKAFLSL